MAKSLTALIALLLTSACQPGNPAPPPRPAPIWMRWWRPCAAGNRPTWTAAWSRFRVRLVRKQPPPCQTLWVTTTAWSAHQPQQPVGRSGRREIRGMTMTDSLAEALPAEIARVSAKRDRWRDIMRDHPEMASGMSLGLAVMQMEIENAVKACASGDVARMMAAHQSLKDYSDDD